MDLTLLPENIIRLWTRNGDCEIQLLSGDITRLPVEDKADIVMVSAFPGDYSPMRGTVIGALAHGLGISTDRLSKNKGIDLRVHFSCWLSKEITVPNSPYRKLLCFEKRRVDMTVAQQISDMFRVFVPVFNNQDNTVITPVLATGHQNHSQPHILGMMVKAAAHWIQAGLPLRCLKIVIYGKIPKAEQETFTDMRTKLMAKNEKMKHRIFKKQYDVYITYSLEDEQQVKHIRHSLEKKKPSIKVYSTYHSFDEQAVWQNNIFNLMIACKRIIAVLSPAFLQSAQCLEQYNMAMCCNRLVGMEVLVPFYIATVANLPTYMGLIQWVDCRERKEGDVLNEKLSFACAKVIEIMTDMKTETPSTTENPTAKEEEKYAYDVFISYSHKNPQLAESVLQAFSSLDDDIKVFYDRSSLTTGSNWQNTLYQSLGSARCIISLISPSYLASTVCMEEYDIGVARFLRQNDDMQFIPVCVEDVDMVPSHISAVKLLDARGQKFSSVVQMVARTVTDWLHNREPSFPDILNKTQVSLEIQDVMNTWRSREVLKMYSMGVKGELVRDPALQISESQNSEPENVSDYDIVLSYGNDAVHCAGTFCHLIDALYDGLNINILAEGGHTRMQAMDTAKVIVMFISQDFVKSHHFMQELHMAICRQRAEKKKILYLIQTMHLLPHPFFTNLLPFDVSLLDQVWSDLSNKHKKNAKQYFLKTRVFSTGRMEFKGSLYCPNHEYLALVKASHDVLLSFLKESAETESPQANLLNIIVMEMKVDQSKQSELNTQYPLEKCLKQIPVVEDHGIRPPSPVHVADTVVKSDKSQQMTENQSVKNPGLKEETHTQSKGVIPLADDNKTQNGNKHTVKQEIQAQTNKINNGIDDTKTKDKTKCDTQNTQKNKVEVSKSSHTGKSSSCIIL